MTDLELRAMSSAIRQTAALLRRASDELVHLSRLLTDPPPVTEEPKPMVEVVVAPKLQWPASAPEPEPLQRSTAAQRSTARRFEYRGEQRTVRDLADLAGCPISTMAERLKRFSAEEAVAFGVADKHRPKPGAGNRKPGPRPKFVTEKRNPTEAAQAAGWGNAIMPAKPAPAKRVEPQLPLQGEPIETADTKRTIAEPKRDMRFAVDPALIVPVFSRMKPGQYMPSESAISKAYGGRA